MSGTNSRTADDGCPTPKRLKISPSPQPQPLLGPSSPPVPASHASHSEQPSASISQRLIELEEQMCRELSLLQFGPPVTHIYNPLSYAAEPHHCYVHSYGNGKKRVLFFGMNPGPFGMAQTGVGGHWTVWNGPGRGGWALDHLEWPRQGWVGTGPFELA